MSMFCLRRLSGILAGTVGGATGSGASPIPARAVRIGFVAVVVALLAGLFQPSPASAAGNGIAVGVFPSFPTRVDLGATNLPANITVMNGSTGAQAAGSLTVTDLTLVASCGNFTPTCAGGADPGVFKLSATGTGEPGTNCAGDTFNIVVIDAATGRVRFTPSDGSPLVLGPTEMATDLDTCRINFTFSVLRMPNVDSYPSLGEPQTDQVGFMSVRHVDGSVGSDQGEDVTTIVGGTPPPPTTTTTVPPATTTTTVPPSTTTTTRPPATTTTTAVPPATTTTTVPPTSTTTVPTSQNGRFIDRAHRDFLGRAPTASEASSWLSAMADGTTRADVAHAITTSAEYRRLVVARYYPSYLGRPASSRELDTQVSAIAGGGQFESAESAVLASDEFYARRGSTPGGFVDALYRMVLGITPDAAGRAFWVDQLVNVGLTRYTLALTFTTHPLTHDRLATQAAYWLLRRCPTANEVKLWSNQLDLGTRQEAFFASLVASDEYWSKV